jgi:transcriptional regulator with XRE-family HTH domain
MSKVGPVGDRLRQRVRAERERHSWSQDELARRMGELGAHCYGATIAKVENGSRGVRVDEIDALATLFGLSTDVLMGRSSRGVDLAWAVSRLSSNAQKIASEIHGLRRRLVGDIEDTEALVDGPKSHDHVAAIIRQATEVVQTMIEAERAMTELANQFPLPKNPAA